MAFAVGFVNATASRASAGSITRINQKNMDTMQFSLISDLHPQIEERPRAEFIPLCFLDRYPLADARQIFEGNSASGVFRTLNKVFGYAMVNVFGEAPFLAAALCQEFPTRAGLFGLQLGAQPVMTTTNGCHFPAAVLMAVAITGDVLNTKIDAKKIINIFRGWFVNFARSKQVELAVDKTKIGLATVATEKFFSPIMGEETNLLPTVYRPNGNFILVELPGQDTAIEGDRSKRLKFPLDFLVSESRV